MLFTVLLAGLFLTAHAEPQSLFARLPNSPAVMARSVAEAPQEVVATVENSDDGFEAVSVTPASEVAEVAPTEVVTEAHLLPAAQTEVISETPQTVAQEETIAVSEPLPQLPVQEEQQIISQEPIAQLYIPEEVPLMSNFPCEGRGRGLFADEEMACQVFVQCQPTQDPHGIPMMQRFLFKCPTGLVFDQRLTTCVRVEDALPCSSSRLFYAETEARFADFIPHVYQTQVVEEPVFEVKGLPKVAQIVEQMPLPAPATKTIVEQLPEAKQIIEEAQVMELPAPVYPVKGLPKVTQVVEQMPLPAPATKTIVQQLPEAKQIIEEAQVVEELPAPLPVKGIAKVAQVVEQMPLPAATKTIIQEPARFVAPAPVFPVKGLPAPVQVVRTLPAPIMSKTRIVSKTSAPKIVEQVRFVNPAPAFGVKSLPAVTRVLHPLPYQVIRRTVAAPMLGKTRVISRTSFPTKKIYRTVY